MSTNRIDQTSTADKNPVMSVIGEDGKELLDAAFHTQHWLDRTMRGLAILIIAAMQWTPLHGQELATEQPLINAVKGMIPGKDLAADSNYEGRAKHASGMMVRLTPSSKQVWRSSVLGKQVRAEAGQSHVQVPLNPA